MVVSRIPESISGWIECGIHILKSGATSGIIQKPSETATMNRLWRLPTKIDAGGQDTDPVGGNHAEHHKPRAAKDGGRQRLDQGAIFGTGRARSGDDPPVTQI